MNEEGARLQPPHQPIICTDTTSGDFAEFFGDNDLEKFLNAEEDNPTKSK